jgi:hypothetical protein
MQLNNWLQANNHTTRFSISFSCVGVQDSLTWTAVAFCGLLLPKSARWPLICICVVDNQELSYGIGPSKAAACEAVARTALYQLDEPFARAYDAQF